jgi:hypothetical protein
MLICALISLGLFLILAITYRLNGNPMKNWKFREVAFIVTISIVFPLGILFLLGISLVLYARSRVDKQQIIRGA